MSARATRVAVGMMVAASMQLLAVAPAVASDWREVAAAPQRVVGRHLDFAAAYCGGGGPNGDDPGLYQCSIGHGALFIEARRLSPTPGARERMKGCGGLDVFEESSFCRFTVSLFVNSARLSRAFDAKRSLPLVDAEVLELR